MKISDFSDDFLFDEMPKIYNPTQKVFITHLHQVHKLVLPKKIPKIYTSAKLAQQLISYFNSRGISLSRDAHFIILQPFSPMELRMVDHKKISILLCEEDEDDAGVNLMILLRHKHALTHFYAGICSNIRRAVLNDTFVEWIRDGVLKLYMNLSRAAEYKDDDAASGAGGDWKLAGSNVDDAVQSIKAVFKAQGKLKARIEVPILGYERLICKLADESRERVAVLGNSLHELCGNLMSMDNFKKQLNKALYVFSAKSQPMDEIRNCYHLYKCIYIKITEEPAENDANKNNVYGYHELQWSPLPGALDLRLLATLLRPAHIYDSRNKLARVPEYLWQLRSQHGKGKFRRKDETVTPPDAKTKSVNPDNKDNTTPKTPTFLRRKRVLRYVEATTCNSDSDDSL